MTYYTRLSHVKQNMTATPFLAVSKRTVPHSVT